MRTYVLSLFVLGCTALQVHAATISVALQDFQASGVLGFKYNSVDTEYASFGVFRLGTADPVGPAAEKLTNPIYAFCDELAQPFTSSYELYNVGVPTDGNDPPNQYVGLINSFKSTLLSELFTKFLDTSWFAPGPYTTAQIEHAMAFHAAIEEIVHEAVFSIADKPSLNLDAGIFQVVDAYLLDKNDPSQLLPDVKMIGQGYLDALTGSDPNPRFALVQLTNPDFQDYITVPETSSLALLSCVGLIVGVGGYLKRRKSTANV